MPATKKDQTVALNPFDDLFSSVYEELRRIASSVRRSDANATISSTALVHETWLKLKLSAPFATQSEAHFKAIAAKAMRQILVDQARRRGARKRGGAGEAVIVSLDDAVEGTLPAGGEFLLLDSLLTELAQISPEQGQIVEHRFFGGMTVDETAAVLGLSPTAVERAWRSARAWLAARLRPERK